MITLLSLLFGFLTSNVPSIFEFFKHKADNAQELALSKLQIQAGLQKLEAIAIKSDSIDLQTSYLPTQRSEIAAVLNEVTKTIIALALITLYCLVCFIYYKELDSMNDPAFFAAHMWTEEDYAFLGAIIGHYYGSKVRKRYA